MRKIRYNIANKKKISYAWFTFLSTLVMLVAVFFLVMGIRTLWSNDKRVQDEKRKNQEDKLKLEELTKQTANYENDIQLKKNSFRREVAFANSLIDGKNYPILQYLDILEKNLPEGVFLTRLVLDADAPTRILFDVTAETLQRLMETYRVFARFAPIIKDEKEKEGLFNASLILNLEK